MLHQSKIEHCLKEIQELEKSFREAQDREILPISFFSYSIDIVNRLKTGIYEIEAAQLQVMREHLKEQENEREDERNNAVEIKESEVSANLTMIEEKTEPTANILADTIGRKISADFGKSLSLNDRFMFQRDLFHGDADEMSHAFAQINAFRSVNEVLKFLDEAYVIPWNSDSGITLKELIDKRFA